MNIYIGNLSHSATENDVFELFSGYGTVTSAKIILDRETRQSRGFAFVEMDDDGGTNAINELNGADFMGRPLKVNEAQPKPQGGGGGGYSRGGGGGGGGYNRGGSGGGGGYNRGGSGGGGGYNRSGGGW